MADAPSGSAGPSRPPLAQPYLGHQIMPLVLLTLLQKLKAAAGPAHSYWQYFTVVVRSFEDKYKDAEGKACEQCWMVCVHCGKHLRPSNPSGLGASHAIFDGFEACGARLAFNRRGTPNARSARRAMASCCNVLHGAPVLANSAMSMLPGSEHITARESACGKLALQSPARAAAGCHE